MDPKVVPDGGGEVLTFTDWAAVIKLAAADTDGTLTVLETRHDAGNGANAHVHSRESETFIVLDGEVRFEVGSEAHVAGPGTVVFGPPGIAHGFEAGAGGARLLHIFVPAGMEAYFRQMHAADSVGGGDFIEIRRQLGVETVAD